MGPQMLWARFIFELGQTFQVARTWALWTPNILFDANCDKLSLKRTGNRCERTTWAGPLLIDLPSHRIPVWFPRRFLLVFWLFRFSFFISVSVSFLLSSFSSFIFFFCFLFNSCLFQFFYFRKIWIPNLKTVPFFNFVHKFRKKYVLKKAQG